MDPREVVWALYIHNSMVAAWRRGGSTVQPARVVKSMVELRRPNSALFVEEEIIACMYVHTLCKPIEWPSSGSPYPRAPSGLVITP